MHKKSLAISTCFSAMMATFVLCTGLLVLLSSPVYASATMQEEPMPTPAPPLPPYPEPYPEPWTEPWTEPACQGSAEISGTVVDADGNPVMDAQAFLISSTQADPFSPYPGVWCGDSMTDANGQFLLSDMAAGEWMLHVTPPWQDGGDQLFESAPISVTLTASETHQVDEPIQLGYAQAFVQVVFPGVEPEWFEGSVVFDPVSGEGDCPAYMMYGPHAVHTSISADGIAYIGGKAPGAYCMSAEVFSEMMGGEHANTAWIVPASILIDIPADAQLLDLGQIEFIAPSKLIAGSVVDDSGAGVPNVSIDVSSDGNSPYGGSWLHATTDASGSFEFTVGGGQWSINLYVDQSIGYTDESYQTVTFTNDETEEVENVQFTIETLDSSITGRLLNADGSPLAFDEMMGMAWVEAHGTDNGFYGQVEPDQNGVFTIPMMPGIYQLNVYVDEWMFPGVFPPAPVEVVIEEDATVDLGDIFMSAPQVTATIVGADGVTPIAAEYTLFSPYDYNDDGVTTCHADSGDSDLPDGPMPESMPPMHYPDFAPGYDSDSNSDYVSRYGYVNAGDALLIGGLVAGDYCLTVSFSTNDGSYLPPLETTFSLVDENALLDLGTLAAAASTKHLIGQVLLPDGSGVQGMNVSAYSYDSYMGGWANAYTDADGTFALDLSAGQWEISIDLYSTYAPMMDEPAMDPMYYDPMYYDPFYGMSQLWFTDEASKMVVFADDDAEETQSVEFNVAQANSTITGTLLKPDGTPAIGVEGDAYANSEQLENSWINGYINPETATFELSVISGEWQVGFNLYDYGSSEYANYTEAVTVTVGENETAQQDFTLVAYDATINGTVLNPDGSPVEYGYAWVNSVEDEADPMDMYAYISRGAEIVNGEFEIKVLSGIEYEVGVETYHDPMSNEFIQPDVQRVTPAPDSTTDVVLQFVAPDSAIVGTVYQSETGEPAAHAEVSAWSTNGQYRYVAADENGAFSLGVQSGSTWYVSAWWYQNSGYVTYHTEGEIEVEIAEAGETSQDLTVVAEDYYLPQAVVETFDSSVAQSITLDDGTVIEVPANAVPVEDIEGDDVRMEITPLTADLPGSYATDSVDYGYDIQIFNNHTDEEITAELNHDLVVTYQYDDAALAEMNADEATLAPAIRTTDADAWDSAENFTVNPEKNEIRMSISQASDAAVTVRPRRDTATEVPEETEAENTEQTIFSFLPLILEQ